MMVYYIKKIGLINQVPSLAHAIIKVKYYEKVVFICVHNSCRSQIGETLCRIFRKDLIPFSAGIMIKMEINLETVRIMKDKYQINMSNQYPKLISDIPKCDLYISMECNVGCPLVKKGFDYNFNLDDPTDKSDEEFIKVIEEIKNKALNI